MLNDNNRNILNIVEKNKNTGLDKVWVTTKNVFRRKQSLQISIGELDLFAGKQKKETKYGKWKDWSKIFILAQAPVTKHHKSGGLNNEHFMRLYFSRFQSLGSPRSGASKLGVW